MLTYSKLHAVPPYSSLVADGPFSASSRWIGRGLASLDRDYPELAVPRNRVAASQLTALIGDYSHPDAPPGTLRLARLAPRFSDSMQRQAVAGHALDFSAPKSVSLLYAFSSDTTRATITAAHAEAIATTVGWLEDAIINTRRSNGLYLPARGVLAAVFDRTVSSAYDPHLHSRVLVSACVQTLRDDKWSRINARPLMQYLATASGLYEATLLDALTTTLNLRIATRFPSPDSPRPVPEIAGIPEALIAAFSTRAAAITDRTNQNFPASRTGTAARRTAATRAAFKLTRTPATAPPTAAQLGEQWHRTAERVLGGALTGEGLLSAASDAATRLASATPSPQQIRALAELTTEHASRHKTPQNWHILAAALSVATTYTGTPAGGHRELAKKLHRRALVKLNASYQDEAILLP